MRRPAPLYAVRLDEQRVVHVTRRRRPWLSSAQLIRAALVACALAALVALALGLGWLP